MIECANGNNDPDRFPAREGHAVIRRRGQPTVALPASVRSAATAPLTVSIARAISARVSVIGLPFADGDL